MMWGNSEEEGQSIKGKEAERHKTPTKLTMSRHKLINNADLDDEIYGYDGAEDYDDNENDNDDGAEEYDDDDDDDGVEELNEEDKEKLASGTIAVRAVLPAEGGNITEKQIHDPLWHYYYDVEKTVRYLVRTYVEPRKPVKKEGEGNSGF